MYGLGTAGVVIPTALPSLPFLFTVHESEMPQAYIDFRLLKETISMYQVLALIGWTASQITRTGRRGPCPLHGSRSPASRSLAVTTDGYFCHGCKANGDVLSFWSKLKGLSPLEAAHDLADEFGIRRAFEQ